MPVVFLHVRVDGDYGLELRSCGADLIPAGFHTRAPVPAAHDAFPFNAELSQTRSETTSFSTREESRREPGSSQRGERIQARALEVGTLAR